MLKQRLQRGSLSCLVQAEDWKPNREDIVLLAILAFLRESINACVGEETYFFWCVKVNIILGELAERKNLDYLLHSIGVTWIPEVVTAELGFDRVKVNDTGKP